MDWYTFLIIVHLIGTVLGVGGATFTEIFYLKAKRDGIFEPYEIDYIRIAVFVMRIGLAILIVSGFGFLLLYRLNGANEMLLASKLWAKLAIILVLILNTYLMQAKKIPMLIGASLSLTSWYAALVLGAWRSLTASFISIIIVYIVAVILVVLILKIVEKRLQIKI